MRSRAAGPQLGHALGPDPGGNFCFFFSCWFSWGLIPSIGVFQGGLGVIYIYYFFSIVVAVLFPRG